MTTVAIMNLKGGTGKTVTAINAAAILWKHYDKDVLVIDADSQANTTEFLSVETDKHGVPLTEGGLADLLRGKDAVIRKTKYRANGSSVDLLPADESLMDLSFSDATSQNINLQALRVELRAWQWHYDFALIDCPPAFNAASSAALLAADEVVIPMKLDAFGIRGMANLKRQLDNMQELNPGLHLAGILPTMFYHSESSDEALHLLRQSGLPMFHEIRRSVRVDDMTFAQEALIFFSPRSKTCRGYRQFVGDLMERCGEV